MAMDRFNNIDCNWIELEGICHPKIGKRRINPVNNGPGARRRNTNRSYCCITYSNLVSINNDEFIVVHNDNIYKYNIHTNKWNLWIKNVLNVNCLQCNIAYDAKTKYIYTTSDSGINIINTNSTQSQTKSVPNMALVPCENTHPSLMVIDSICHIVGPSLNNFHSFWNNKTNKIEVVNAFTQPIVDELFNTHHNKKYTNMEATDKLCEFGLVYASKTKEIYCIGGGLRIIDWGVRFREIYHSILKYSIQNDEWTELDIALPHKQMEHFGCVITKDERYIILLGGCMGEQMDEEYDECEYIETDVIYVFDLQTLTLSKSKIKIPFLLDDEPFEIGPKIYSMTERYLSVLTENVFENNLLIHGLLKQAMKLNGFYMPMALINVISLYHTFEYIHVINSYDGQHWKINVDKIIKSIS
eukprot:546305_1